MVWTVRLPLSNSLAGGASSRPVGGENAQEPKSWSPTHADKPAPIGPPGLSDNGPEVTRRQLECLAWVAEGKSAIEIGIILGISDRTVEKHIAKICSSFGVSRRIQAVDYARRLGLIAPE